MRTSSWSMIVGLSILLPVCLSDPARAQKDPEAAVGKSLQVLSEITRNPKTGMPRLVTAQGAGDRDHPRHVQDELHLRRPVRPRRAGGPPAGWHLEQPCLHSPVGRKLRSPGWRPVDRPGPGLPEPEGARSVPQGQGQAHAGCRRRGRGRACRQAVRGEHRRGASRPRSSPIPTPAASSRASRPRGARSRSTGEPTPSITASPSPPPRSSRSTARWPFRPRRSRSSRCWPRRPPGPSGSSKPAGPGKHR